MCNILLAKSKIDFVCEKILLVNKISIFKPLVFTVLFLIKSIGGLAQIQDSYTPQKLITPSPTAASLGVYGSTDVSYYSGTPDISVPLYDLKTLNHSFPITLRYNASGTRAWEDASWVGLGWSLNSGGVITQTIRGLDDFGNYGYYNGPSLPSRFTPLPSSSINFFNEMLQNRNDGEPDIISYNIGQYSGRFLLGKKRDGSQVFMDHQNNLKLELIGYSWRVTDPQGYKYYLGTSEGMTDYNYSGNVELDNNTFVNFKEDYDRIPNTAKYLDSIVSPNGEVLKFIYDRKGQSLSLISKSQQIFHLLNTLGGCVNNTFPMPAIVELHNASRQVIRNIYLRQIVSSQGTIEFITSDREDIGYLGTIKPSKLSEIIVKNLKGEQVKKYKLDYGYFSQANTDGRLKLDKVTEYETEGNSKSPYTFSYFKPDQVPAKNTKSIDHWGYYNGEPNTSLVPELSVPEVKKYFKGAIRQADSIAVYPKAGVLASILYPTGGTTSYDFELHDYSNLSGDDRFGRVLRTANAYARPGDEYSQDSQVFTIKDTLNVSLSYSYMKHREDANNITNVQTEFVYLYYQNSPMAHWGTWPCPGQPDPTCGFTDGSTKFSEMILLPGTYKIQVRYLQGYSTSASLRWYEKVRLNQRKGAGLRVKSIKNNDRSGKEEIKTFLYSNDGKTSGKLISQQKYDFYGYVQGNPGQDGCDMGADYVGRSAVSVTAPGLNSDGTTVGYDKVTELIGENGEGGRTEFYYNNIENGIPDYPFTPQSSFVLNGKLSLVLVYNSKGTLIKKTKYEYDRKVEEYLPGVKLYQFPMFAQYRSYWINHYNNISSWSVMSAKSETDYDISGNVIATTKRNYFYDNPSHKELTREDNMMSKGGKTIVTYKYPGDVTSEISDSLASKGQIGVILEKSRTQGNSVTKTIYDYMIVSPMGGLLPASVKSKSSLDNIEEVRVRYHNYDLNGNVLSLSKEGGAKINYVWSYNGQYPIAEVSNANYNTIESLLGGKLNVESFSKRSNPTDLEIQNFLSPLRNPSNLQESTLAIFTYKPLIGMTSSEDFKGLKTYYDYDNYNRLLNVRNHNKNIINNYEYNYQHKAITTHWNTPESGSFRKNCPSGQTGSDVLYVVPEGMFSSTVSVEDANRQARAYVQQNGQAYANANGTCNINNTTVSYSYTYGSPWTISGLLVNKTTNQSYFLFAGAQSTPTTVLPIGEYRFDITWVTSAEQGKYYVIGLNGNNQVLNTSYGSGKQSYNLSISAPYVITLKYQ